jgi:hypothetical protein
VFEEPTGETIFQSHICDIVELAEGQLVDAVGHQGVKLDIAPDLLGILPPFCPIDEGDDGKDRGFDLYFSVRSDDFDAGPSANLQRGNQIRPFHSMPLPLELLIKLIKGKLHASRIVEIHAV